MQIDNTLTLSQLKPKLERLFQLSEQKILAIEENWEPKLGTPVFTVDGQYTTRGWTEWTQGFQFGSALLQYDVTDDTRFLQIGQQQTVDKMATHVSHVGVHDHGFNNISTYGNLRRLILEGRIPDDGWQKHFCELAIKASAAVQASRWTTIHNGSGFIYSFNGPHSLFSDTIRSLRILAAGHKLGHVLMGEGDQEISLLTRLLQHSQTTADYNVYYGEGRDAYDIRGRVVHESVFNTNDGNYRCPSTQQGYSPFSTWTRGLAWIITGYAEQLEFFAAQADNNVLSNEGSRRSFVPNKVTQPLRPQVKNQAPKSADKSSEFDSADEIVAHMVKAVLATADFYIDNSAVNGIPYWDTGAPGLVQLDNYLDQPADPYNKYEPVDSSAAAIAAQGFIRLGRYFESRGTEDTAGLGSKYFQAGLTIADTLLSTPYLSESPDHQGLILHSVYHRPNGWDHVPDGQSIPCGESSMWGDYHARELGALLWRLLEGKPYLTFF